MVGLLIVDMQVGSLLDSDKHDVEGVVSRINGLADRVRAVRGKVVFIQHDGTSEENLVLDSAGWEVLAALSQEAGDLYISKTTNDSFYNTRLQKNLEELCIKQLIICGWATDQCVDSTIRAAISRDYEVIVGEDCHTVSDRTITAEQVIKHHNGIWSHLLAPGKPVKVLPAKEIEQMLE